MIVNGRLFGSIPGNKFLPFVNSLENGDIFEDCLKQSCIADQVGDPKDRQMPTISADYLSSVPYALTPLLSHPITSIKNVQNGYSVSGLVLFRQTITVPSDYLPREISQSAGSVLPNAGGYNWSILLASQFGETLCRRMYYKGMYGMGALW